MQVTGGGRLDDVEWADVRPYVMFITGRCGSTWLTELLKATGVAGDPREWLNSDIATYSEALTDSLSGYFANVVARHSSGDRFGLQIDPIRVRDTLRLVDWETVFPPNRTQTFFLYRRDLAAQAWSWVHARKSGIWHSSDQDRREGIDPDHAPTTRELVDEIVALRRREEYLFAFWAERGYEPRFLEYETLAADPSATVATILRDLGSSDDEAERLCKSESKSKPLIYDDSKAAGLAKLEGFNWPTLALLERDRFGYGADWLGDHLVGVEPIAAHLVGADSLAER